MHDKTNPGGVSLDHVLFPDLSLDPVFSVVQYFLFLECLTVPLYLGEEERVDGGGGGEGCGVYGMVGVGLRKGLRLAGWRVRVRGGCRVVVRSDGFEFCRDFCWGGDWDGV